MRQRHALLLASACALLGLGLLRGRSGPAPESASGAAPAPPAQSSALAAPAPPPPDPETAAAAPALPQGTAPAAPIIDEITVEKKEVCQGEENLVTVRAHTADGTDAHLHYLIAGSTGAAVPVRRMAAESGSAPQPLVTVFGKDNAATDTPLPRYKINDCQVPRYVVIVPRLRPNANEEYELQARIMEFGSRAAGTPPFEPLRYRWDYGDGTTEVTTAPYAVHSYAERAQKTLYSNFLVSVEIEGRSTERLRGRHALQLMNSVFEAREAKGIVVLLSDASPRFPEVSSEGYVRQRFRLWHLQDGPVMISAVTARYEHQRPEQSGVRSLEPGRFIPGGQILPGRKVEVAVEFDSRKEPDLLAVHYELSGESEDGLPVRGTFSLMRPTPEPTPESGTPVLDPVLMAKIRRAQQLLGQRFVTDEDLFSLERAGKFADLRVEARPREAGAELGAPPAPSGRKPAPGNQQPRDPDRTVEMP